MARHRSELALYLLNYTSPAIFVYRAKSRYGGNALKITPSRIGEIAKSFVRALRELARTPNRLKCRLEFIRDRQIV
jgi:hypothetical protein